MTFPSCFITGTDTDAGKTLVTASLLRYLDAQGVLAAGLKPIASGFDQVDGQLQNHDIESLKQASNVNLPNELINLYAFEPAIAPHIAAQEHDIDISFDAIKQAVNEAKTQVDCVVVEGVGGWRVPLSYCDDRCDQPCAKHADTIATLAGKLNLPVILVVGLQLGCLNHALLSAQAIMDDGLPLLGWVANNLHETFDRKHENMQTLMQLMPVPLLFEVPFLLSESERGLYAPKSIALP